MIVDLSFKYGTASLSSKRSSSCWHQTSLVCCMEGTQMWSS